jgi:hypothetical protein
MSAMNRTDVCTRLIHPLAPSAKVFNFAERCMS